MQNPASCHVHVAYAVVSMLCSYVLHMATSISMFVDLAAANETEIHSEQVSIHSCGVHHRDAVMFGGMHVRLLNRVQYRVPVTPSIKWRFDAGFQLGFQVIEDGHASCSMLTMTVYNC